MCINVIFSAVLAVDTAQLVIGAGLLINVVSVIIAFRLMRRSLANDLDERFNKKADKIYVDKMDEKIMKTVENNHQENSKHLQEIKKDVRMILDKLIPNRK